MRGKQSRKCNKKQDKICMWRCKSALNHKCIWIESKSIALLRLTFMVTESISRWKCFDLCCMHKYTHIMYAQHTFLIKLDCQCRAIGRLQENEYMFADDTSGIICKTCEIPRCTCCRAHIPSSFKRVHFEHECVQDERIYVINIFHSPQKPRHKTEHVKFSLLPAYNLLWFSSKQLWKKEFRFFILLLCLQIKWHFFQSVFYWSVMCNSSILSCFFPLI